MTTKRNIKISKTSSKESKKTLSKKPTRKKESNSIYKEDESNEEYYYDKAEGNYVKKTNIGDDTLDYDEVNDRQ